MIKIYKTGIHFEDKNRALHRLNGPAAIGNMYESWWKNGNRHRIGGPAVTDAIYVEYWINHVQYAYHIYTDKVKEFEK